MAPKGLGLWILFLLIQEGVSAGGEKDCPHARAIQGEYVELKCCYPEKDLSDSFRVQWQLQGKDDCVVAACLPDSIAEFQCERYKNRTKFENYCLHLVLLNVSLEDNKTYECILQKKKEGAYQKIFHGLIRFEVVEMNDTANESQNATYLESPTPNHDTHDNQQQIYVMVMSLAAAVVFITIIIWILTKRKCSLHRAYNAPVGMGMS
ncbi:PREDICTED: T-lymphocyte activation antigen CD80-like [Gekko japonicus]|uniref:T-lymphocyte activation antigen CD80-like n=1 Tax=Gekko japonicus TaxID=146911 RepID=A0ABM1JV01_GEKJA|nr:PREDICTED: T-lymphocyte activation antigen CD80-like [Gekko japonicus]